MLTKIQKIAVVCPPIGWDMPHWVAVRTITRDYREIVITGVFQDLQGERKEESIRVILGTGSSIDFRGKIHEAKTPAAILLDKAGSPELFSIVAGLWDGPVFHAVLIHQKTNAWMHLIVDQDITIERLPDGTDRNAIVRG